MYFNNFKSGSVLSYTKILTYGKKSKNKNNLSVQEWGSG